MSQAYDMLSVYSLQVVKERGLKYPTNKVRDQNEAASVMNEYLKDRSCEHLAIILLDGQNNMIGISTITIGELSGLSCSIRSVFEHVIGGRANAFVLGHNHPSGNVNPSPEDIIFTKNLIKACGIMGVPCLDHIIVSSGLNDDVYSFAANLMM